jgi:hypothetical protein
VDAIDVVDHIRTHYTEDQLMEQVNNYPRWRKNRRLDLDGKTKRYIEIYVPEPF